MRRQNDLELSGDGSVLTQQSYHQQLDQLSSQKNQLLRRLKELQEKENNIEAQTEEIIRKREEFNGHLERNQIHNSQLHSIKKKDEEELNEQLLKDMLLAEKIQQEENERRLLEAQEERRRDIEQVRENYVPYFIPTEQPVVPPLPNENIVDTDEEMRDDTETDEEMARRLQQEERQQFERRDETLARMLQGVRRNENDDDLPALPVRRARRGRSNEGVQPTNNEDEPVIKEDIFTNMIRERMERRRRRGGQRDRIGAPPPEILQMLYGGEFGGGDRDGRRRYRGMGRFMLGRRGNPPDNASYEQLLELDRNNVKVGVRGDILSMFPVRSVKDTEKLLEEECSICKCDFEEKERVKNLPCMHVFHEACIDQWLTDNKKCPICYQDAEVLYSKSQQGHNGN